MPGSNLKLATAFAALRELGPDTTLSTKIVATSPPEEGTINGDLYVVGGGDPLIVTDNYLATSKYGAYPHTSLAAISDAITAAGITRISGSIRGDDSRYDALRSVPSWPDRYLAEAQVGPLSALSLNDARTYPVGTFDSGIPRPAADPSAYGAIGLTEQLRARGIAVEGMPGSGVAPANGTVVTDVPSLPVQQIVSEMLTFSDNNTAELLLKELGRHRAGQGSTAAGLDVVRDVLTKAGLGVDGFDPHDGSGLDRGDRATCSLLAALVAKDGTDGQIATGMAVAGRTGTLRDRFRSSQAAGEVRAKTGTLNDVTALSGWVHTTKDADVAFSYLLNTDGRRVGPDDLTLQEQLTEALRSYPDSPDLASLGPKPPVDR